MRKHFKKNQAKKATGSTKANIKAPGMVSPSDYHASRGKDIMKEATGGRMV